MNLQRFKQLESEVHTDLHDYISIKRTVSGFKPQYCTPRTQVVTNGTEGLNEIAYNEGYNDRQKHNKKDYEKTKSSLKVKQLKEKGE